MPGEESRNRIRFSTAENDTINNNDITESLSVVNSIPKPIQNDNSSSEKGSSDTNSIQNMISQQPRMKETSYNSHGTVTESGTESQKSGQKSVSIAGSYSSEYNDKSSSSISTKSLLKNKKKGSRQVSLNSSQEKQIKGNKNSKKQDSSCTDSSDGFSNTGSSSSSKNVSEGGYAGSASSNEDSNEASQQTNKTNEQQKRAKTSNTNSFSSSEIADFSSGTIDSGSGCSTFLSCSDFSEETAKPNISQQELFEENNYEKNSKNKKCNDSQDANNSDASLDSSSSLRAVAPIRNYQSSKTSTPPSSHTSGKEEKKIDLPTNNYFVSFKKRKKNKKPRRKNDSIEKEHVHSKHKSSKHVLRTTSKSPTNNSKQSAEVSSQGDGYHTQQESLKRNFLDAFSSQKNQHLLRLMNNSTSRKYISASSSSTSRKNDSVNEKRQNKKCKVEMKDESSHNPTPIYDVGSDIMAHILSFLTHLEAHSLLITPLSKKWCETYMFPQDLWKILCLSPPFYVKVNSMKRSSHGHLKRSRSDESIATSYSGYGTSSDRSEDSFSSYPAYTELRVKHIFGIYRLLYSSFVKCVRYLEQIKEDSSKGRTPRGMKHNFVPRGPNGKILDFDDTAPIEKYLAALKGSSSEHSESSIECNSDGSCSMKDAAMRTKRIVQVESKPAAKSMSISSVECVTKGKGDKCDSYDKITTKKQKPKIGRSKLTERLLGATKHGNAGPVDLPWSCAIYSVVNWMVAFIDVLGIQIMCLKVLPCLLEDEHQRTTAQRAGLTDIVLKGMVLFPDSVELHTAAFHTLVLLARPLGGREGMLFHQTMVGDSSGILNISSASKSNCCKNGIAVMLDSMRRFHANERLQAMSCWSMVNIALIASQKTMLVKLGGISVAANAMMQHPNSAEVQFRALFALINLAIPCNTQNQRQSTSNPRSNLGEIMSDASEKEILDESIGQISNLVVVAMKNFCSSEAIMNRACLVLHNLSLEEQYHPTLLWTPNCYQMLEWAMGNYRHDHVLQQSAGGTLQRLQKTLRNNRDLHTRFSSFIRMQQQSSLERARREAQLLENQRKKTSDDRI